MKTDEALKLIGESEFLDKIYNFSYHRCNTSHDAEELCSDIILSVLQAVQKTSDIENLYAFVWTVAHRVYADFSKKRASTRAKLSPLDSSEAFLESKSNEIEEFIEKESEKQELKRIFKSIAFLSHAYRDVMIMYYLDGKCISEIAKKLNVSETAVKQRLFSARNTVRKEVKTMNNNVTLKPIHFACMGTGNPIGNDPREVANRMFSQNLIYLCRKKPKTASELAEELYVPMPYIEEELEIQCHGLNGEYGNLKRLENGRYVSNIIVADYSEYKNANKIYTKHTPELIKALRKSLEKFGDEILSFPYLSPQNNLAFILWVMLNRAVWNFSDDINQILKDKYFAEHKSPERPFSTVAVAYKDGEVVDFNFWGCDGIWSKSIEGYQAVHINNSYGKHFDAHFHCAHNISNDETLLMLIKAVGGLKIDSLTETEKEISAKAIEVGYLSNVNNVLVPKIVVMKKKDTERFCSLVNRLFEGTDDIKEEIAKNLSEFIKANLPEHLTCEYKLYSTLIDSTGILGDIIDECIKEKLLTTPEKRICAEGVEMIIE